jgi:hypothetical protein
VTYGLTALIATVGILVGTPVIAHHGAATFDTGKKLVMEGSVTEWVWSNPHCFLKLDVQEKDGTVRHWVVETSNPPDMVNRGWSRRSFKAGEKVTITVEPVKSGNPVGRLLTVTFADGKVLSTQGGGGDPAAGREGAPRQ